MYNKYSFSICVLLFVVLENRAENPTVNTTHGKISGRVLRTLIKNVSYYGFMGIPFAVPPIKDLRFLAPRPIDPWDGVLRATKEKKACIQFNNNVKKGQPLGHYGVEDCLYLDIYTPGLDKSKRAVIVFLHNEQFTYSYNKTKDYSPDFIIEDNVIVVTISHRLSVFGFLSLEDELLPGNSGLKDFVMGLQWIKSNVEHFGGDPNRLILMGSKGGATAIDLLIHSKAKKLFQSAILQSGTSWISMYLQDNPRERAFTLAESFERISSNNHRLLEDLNDIRAEDLLAKELNAIPKDYFKENQRSILAFGPTVEKDPKGLVIEYPEYSLEKINVPIMIGFNSREGLEPSLQYLIEPKYLSFVQKDFPLLMPRRVKFKLDPLHNSYYDAVNDIKRFYFSETVKIRNIPEYVTYIGDVLTMYAMDYMTRIYSNISSKSVYYYHFDYYSDLSENKNNLMKISTVVDGTWGAATGDELCYLFKCPDLEVKYLRHNQTMSEEMILLRKMVRMWTNFAKYGNPTPDGDDLLNDLKWPPYNTDTKEYLHVDKEMKVKRELYEERFQFWEQFIGKWERKAVNGIVSDKWKNNDEL